MHPNCEEPSWTVLDRPRELKRPKPREIVAAILFDSLTEPFAGARGATDARQVVMRAEELDIHLKISTNPAEHQIIGQVFARNQTEFLSSVRVHVVAERKAFQNDMQRQLWPVPVRRRSTRRVPSSTGFAAPHSSRWDNNQ